MIDIKPQSIVFDTSSYPSSLRLKILVFNRSGIDISNCIVWYRFSTTGSAAVANYVRSIDLKEGEMVVEESLLLPEDYISITNLLLGRNIADMKLILDTYVYQKYLPEYHANIDRNITKDEWERSTRNMEGKPKPPETCLAPLEIGFGFPWLSLDGVKLKGEVDRYLKSDLGPLFLSGGVKAVEDKLAKKYENVAAIAELIEVAKTGVSKNLDENWALATLSLVLIENTVKSELAKLGQPPTRKEHFQELADKLAKEQKKKGIDIDYARLRSFYEGRHVAVHEAHEYTISNEMATESFQFIKTLIERLRQKPGILTS